MNINQVNGTITELTSANGTDENSLSYPTAVSPVVRPLTADTTVFNYTFKANSVNVLKLNTDTQSALIQPVSSISPINVYPTFTHNEISINTTDQGRYSVSVINASGQQMIQKEASGLLKLDMSDLTAGVYLIRVVSDNDTFVKKVIRY
jgi:hypothetical protein